MIEQFLFENWWPGPVAWVLLYVSDYLLTIRAATIYRARVKGTLVFEGSFEITPFFQKDVDALRRVSPRFLLALVFSTDLLLVLWRLSTEPPTWRAGYLSALGGLVLGEFAVHLRHLRTLHLFTVGFRADGVRGRLEYPRQVLLKMSAFEFAQMAVLFAVLSMVTSSWFLAGGAASCALVSLKHWRFASKARANAG